MGSIYHFGEYLRQIRLEVACCVRIYIKKGFHAFFNLVLANNLGSR